MLRYACGTWMSIIFNLRFPGQYYDKDSGQFYNHNRYYNPELGRYMEPDPIGLEGGLNMFAYAGSNPVMNVDPSGLSYDPNGVLNYHIPDTLVFNNMDMSRIAGIQLSFERAATSFINSSSTYTTNNYSSTSDMQAMMVIRAGIGLIRRGGARDVAANVAKNAEQTVVRTTRSGETAARITKSDGSVADISATRVKEYVPNTHPNAPPGTLNKVKFPNAQPGSKGYKRDPTLEELERLRRINEQSNF